MNAALDYDTLELLGAAIRESERRATKEPLPDDLAALCDRLGRSDDFGDASAEKPAEERRN